MIVRLSDKWGGTGTNTGLLMLLCRMQHQFETHLSVKLHPLPIHRAGRVLANRLSQAGLSVLVYIHYCLIAAAVACIAASLANNPFQEGELQDWALDSVGLFVWILIGAVAVLAGKHAWTWWQSLQEEMSSSSRASLSKEDPFTL